MDMAYLKEKIRALRSEYTRPDRHDIIKSAKKCAICSRKAGAIYIFGPTNYIKERLKFKIYLDVHTINGGGLGPREVVLCTACHLNFHLFNRLSERAEFGKRLSKTIYKRCKVCGELVCRCCLKCGKSPKWCKCKWCRCPSCVGGRGNSRPHKSNIK